MKLTKENVNEIMKKISLHDGLITNFNYNNEERELNITYLDEWQDNKECNIIFIDVIGFKITSCNYWSNSPYISCIVPLQEYEYILMPELFKKAYDNPDWLNEHLISRDEYMELLMEFISGDTLSIVCKSVKVKN